MHRMISQLLCGKRTTGSSTGRSGLSALGLQAQSGEGEHFSNGRLMQRAVTYSKFACAQLREADPAHDRKHQ